MSPNTFIAWAIAAAVTLVAALGVTFSEPAVTTVRLTNEPAFPLLRADPDAVVKITVTTREAGFTLVRGEDGAWTAPDKFGYRAAPDKVRALVVGLADMRLVEAKTKRPDRYERLQVEDVTTEYSTSRLLRLADAQDTVLAEVILGKRSEGFTAGQDAGTYLRRPGEEQSWLASGGPEVEDALIDWLDRGVVDLENDRIRRIEVSPAATERYVAFRDAEAGQFRLETMPEGRALLSGALGRQASGLSNLSLMDVKPRTELSLPANRSVAILTTFYGLVVTTELATIAEEHWAFFQARAVAQDDQDAEQAKSARKEAEAINARVGAWAFQIDTFAAERLGKPLEELLQKKDGTS